MPEASTPLFDRALPELDPSGPYASRAGRPPRPPPKYDTQSDREGVALVDADACCLIIITDQRPPRPLCLAPKAIACSTPGLEERAASIP